ncbi:4a-hydroxytetrahydrobiopterin dehydratase [Kribbella sp. VKM Ac-2569]|uniref:VOC family protein n=1 Tax=Kribbella sp. VKM Ac-2569 TaxID=2512220 RepID=UPI00102BF0DB|nr:VOC family protein [Kribbella sp. VKM Ac-2569]RZT17145.1 4a-hydroxytetrahydrobiopterin dehydratase [Kribbella sp. VKM Ac-2569]
MVPETGLQDWRKLAQKLHARFLIDAYADGVRFVAAVGEASQDVVPEVRLSASFVDVATRDAELAGRISAIAAEQGLTADPTAVAQLEIGLDTADLVELGPFWAAVLTGSTEAFTDNDIFDPTGRIANLWFQGTTPHETPRQRFHLDLWLPPEVVPGRIEAALAAGGKVTYDEEAPAFIVLADPQGNKVCLCTSESR